MMEALSSLEKALLVDPNCVRALVEKGEILQDAGEVRRAHACHDRAIRIDGRCVAGWLGLGAALVDMGMAGDALGAYEQALKLSPADPRGWTGKGNALDRLGRGEAALTCFDRALAMAPRHVNAWNNKGCCLEALGRIEEAVSCFDRAIEIEPRFAHAWHNRGNCLARTNRHEEAIACFDRALSIATFAAAMGSRGSSLRALGRREEALASFAKAVDSAPAWAAAWFGKASVEVELGREAEAARSLKRYLELETDSTSENARWAREYMALLGRMQNSAAVVAERLETLDRALAADAGDFETWLDKGDFLETLERDAEALVCYVRGVAVRPQSAEAWWRKARCEQRLNLREENARSLERYLAVAPPEHVKEIAWATERIGLHRQIEAKQKELDDLHRQITEILTGEARAALEGARAAGFRWNGGDEFIAALIETLESEEEVRRVVARCRQLAIQERDAGRAVTLEITRPLLDRAIAEK